MVARVAGAEGVGAEVPGGLVARQDVGGGDQDGMRAGDGCPGGPPTAAEPRLLRREVRVFGAPGGLGRLSETRAQPLPSRPAPNRMSPALSVSSCSSADTRISPPVASPAMREAKIA